MRWSQNVNTSEDTKCGTSVVADTLQSLGDRAKLCRETIDLIEAGQHVNRTDAVAGLGKLLDSCQNLRDAILSEDSAASWNTKEELSALVSRLGDAAEKRRRYLDLAQFLASGTVSHRRERTKQERLELRDAAVAELLEISALSSPPDLPGPAVNEWLNWACSLDDESNEPDLRHLKNNFPHLDDFVRQLEIEWWRDGESSTPAEMGASIPSITPGPNATAEPTANEAAPQAGSISLSTDLPIDQTSSEKESDTSPTSIATSALAVEEKEIPEVDPGVAELLKSASIEMAKTSSPKTEEPGDDSVSYLTNSVLNGKLSFFSWSDIEHFSRHIEKSKTQPKEDRTVRALVAASHWLEPRLDNPVLNPTCGICVLTGYKSDADVAVVDPDVATKIVNNDDDLPLFAGGADLLRWGLLQPSEDLFNGIASIRRLRFDQIKSWFGELYKIELAEQQFQDIYTLTSGIPILVGEMHKLIIPVPEDPPTWIGHAPWIEIKLKFERRLSAVALELKSGAPSVRLSDREISVLKMVVIASKNSNAENILSNLTDNWQNYNRREHRPLSSRDESTVALLQDLGLLPMRRANGLERMKALLPLESGDAMRQIVSYL
jgi:hypothetical protein